MSKHISFTDLVSEEKRLQSELHKLTDALAAIQTVIKYYSDNSKIESVFDDSLGDTNIERVFNLLKKVGRGTAMELGKILYDANPNELTEERAFQIATYELSQLKRNGSINGEKIPGKKRFLYSIKNS